MISERIIIGSRNRNFVNDLSDAVLKVAPNADIVTLESKTNLIDEIANTKRIFVLCDKFFFGINPKKKLMSLRMFNSNIRFAVCDYTTQQQMFAYRLYKIGFDGFINEIENSDFLVSALKTYFQRGKYYPTVIYEDIRSAKYLGFYEFLGDISDIEFEIGIKRIFGFTAKEIGGKNPNKIDVQFHRFKKKIGIVNSIDCLNFLESFKRGDFI